MLEHSSTLIAALKIILQRFSLYLDGKCPEKIVVELEDEKWEIEGQKGTVQMVCCSILMYWS